MTITARGRDWTGKGGVAEFNATLEAVAAAHGIVVVDISPVYEAAATDPSLILHGGPWPSARQYAGWVELIGQKMRHSLTVASP